jgi:hypothetical protein
VSRAFPLAGFWLLSAAKALATAAGFWLLASGFWLLASGFWLLASGLKSKSYPRHAIRQLKTTRKDKKPLVVGW